MNKILSNVVIHKDYSKDIVRILKSNRSDEVIRKKLSKYHENDIADAVKLLDKEKEYVCIIFWVLTGPQRCFHIWKIHQSI